jgi:hypothetical protein
VEGQRQEVSWMARRWGRPRRRWWSLVCRWQNNIYIYWITNN